MGKIKKIDIPGKAQYIARNDPTYAQIEITNECNLKCRMCAHSNPEWRKFFKSGRLAFQDFKFILSHLPRLDTILLNGVGEPLLNPDLGKMIRYSGRRGVRISFYTNATLLTPEKSRELLLTNSIDKIFISIDAGKAKTYEAIRIGAKFYDVWFNIENFINLMKLLGKDKPNINIWMLMMGENIKETPLLLKKMKKIGLKNLNIAKLKRKIFTPVIKNNFTLMRALKDLAYKNNVNLEYRNIFDRHMDHKKPKHCLDPWRMVYINVDGEVNPCCFSFMYKSARMGNIFREDFKKIWNNQKFLNFRKNLLAGKQDCCQRCPRNK